MASEAPPDASAAASPTASDNIIANTAAVPPHSSLEIPAPATEVKSDNEGPLSTQAETASAAIPTLPKSEIARSDANDPNSVLVSTLRLQNNDLQSQVTGLNTKLVHSFGRLGDLEESLDRANQELEEVRARCGKLAEERERWEARVEGGMLVEKAHVQTELTRMMDRVIEETAQRGKAEADKATIETELEALSASLFAEANRMVTVEREGRLRAEEKSASLEDRLRDTEGIMGSQAEQMRQLGGSIEQVEQERDELRARIISFQDDPSLLRTPMSPETPVATFPDGETVALTFSQPASPRLGGFNPAHALPELLMDILPHHEFHIFVRHLHRLRINTLSKPYEALSPAASAAEAQAALHALLPLNQHLSQPFLKRCVEEDSDPALRLDLAPGLNWLTRRNVSQAIVDGQLVIEPAYGALPPSEKCSLCGASLERYLADANGEAALPSAPSVTGGQAAMRKLMGTQSWSTQGWTRWGGRSSSTPPPSSSSTPSTEKPLPHLHASSSIFIFRPHDASTTGARHALCPTYCLPRLRAVCEFWTAIRHIERSLLLGERAPTPGAGSGAASRDAAAASRKGLGIGSMTGLLRRTGSADARGPMTPTNVTPANELPPLSPVQAAPIVAVSKEGDAEVATERKSGEAKREGDVKEDGSPESKEAKLAAPTDGSSMPSSDNESSGAITAAEGTPAGSPTETPTVVLPKVSLDEPREVAVEAEQKDEAPSTPPTESLAVPAEPRAPSPAPPSVTDSPKPPPLPKRSEARAPRAASPAPPSPALAPSQQTLAPAQPPRPPPRRSMPAPSSHSVVRQPSLDILTSSGPAWEEKAWQDLTKLRETLFWVRVGAVLPSSSSV